MCKYDLVCNYDSNFVEATLLVFGLTIFLIIIIVTTLDSIKFNKEIDNIRRTKYLCEDYEKENEDE